MLYSATALSHNCVRQLLRTDSAETVFFLTLKHSIL